MLCVQITPKLTSTAQTSLQSTWPIQFTISWTSSLSCPWIPGTQSVQQKRIICPLYLGLLSLFSGSGTAIQTNPRQKTGNCLWHPPFLIFNHTPDLRDSAFLRFFSFILSFSISTEPTLFQVLAIFPLGYCKSSSFWLSALHPSLLLGPVYLLFHFAVMTIFPTQISFCSPLLKTFQWLLMPAK